MEKKTADAQRQAAGPTKKKKKKKNNAEDVSIFTRWKGTEMTKGSISGWRTIGHR